MNMWGRALVGTLLWLCCLPLPARAGDAQLAELQAEVNLHRSLLNKHLDLPVLHSYSATARTWRPYVAKPARVRVVSLWSLNCQPCIDELPMLTEIAEQRGRQSRDVQFLFLADPPEENSQQDLEQFWISPNVARLAERCKPEGLGNRSEQAGQPACLLNLHRAEMLRSPAVDGSLVLPTNIRPLTLLLDESGAVRNVFVGSLRSEPRRKQLEKAIDNLLESTRARASTTPRSSRHS